MRYLSKAINSLAVILVLVYVFLTHQVYSFIIHISGNLTSTIYIVSKIPYYFLWGGLIINILSKVLRIFSSKQKNLVVFYLSEILVIILLIGTFVFKPNFEFLYSETGDIYPDSYRYDNLFVYNKFYSNEGDYEGGYGDTKYIYVPFTKKIYYFSPEGVKNYKVEFVNKEKVKIGDNVYTIHKSWFVES